MKKERFFPYWTDLARVIPVLQARIARDIRLTLVSVEIYSSHGFLLTFNFETVAPIPLLDLTGRGWMRANITDDSGNKFTGMLAMIPGVSYRHIFSGRAVMICRPPLTDQAGGLTITIDSIEWEFTASEENPPPSAIFVGPWEFAVSLS